jgi:putative FmdB family regulatory protein
MSSYFDNSFYPFRCEACGARFRKVLRVLVDSDEVRCPRCHSKIDLRDSKHASDIRRALARAAELDQGSVARNLG